MIEKLIDFPSINTELTQKHEPRYAELFSEGPALSFRQLPGTSSSRVLPSSFVRLEILLKIRSV